MQTEPNEQESPDYTDALNSRFDERYVAAYNEIDHCMRERLRQPTHVTFSAMAKQYCADHPWISYYKPLMVIANLRNLVEHSMTDPSQPMFLPSRKAVQEIEDLRDRMLNPETVVPRWERLVVSVEDHTDMKTVMNLVNNNDFSQFPVFMGERFLGLLTENGITRCLAKRIHDDDALVNLPPTKVGDVLKWEDDRENVIFVKADCTIDHLVYRFANKPSLEAALITTNGNRSRALRGIATRFDIMTLKRH